MTSPRSRACRPGPCSYYFTDFAGLLTEVYQRASERFFRDRMDVVTEIAGTRDKLSAMISTGIPWSSDDALVTALYRLDSYLAFRQTNSAMVTALFDKQVALYLRGILETGQAQGHFELQSKPLDIAQNLVALEDAYGLHITTDNRALTPPRAAALIDSYAAVATRCSDIPQRTEPAEPPNGGDSAGRQAREKEKPLTANNARARELGIELRGAPGPLNAITDVAGVEVGYATLIHGDGPLTVGRGPVRTGVTAILPRGRDGVGNPCTAGRFSFNGNGEMTGSAWIDEVGELSLPITISNTHAIGACHTGVIEWVNATHPRLARQWLLPVCAETWDGYLNDINGGHVTPAVVRQALDAAHGGAPEEGSVGGGTGMNCYGFKGGNGTSSRLVPFGDATFTVGVFVQANFGSREELTITGTPVGQLMSVENPTEDTDWLEQDLRVPGGAGSVIVVVATDAPLSPAAVHGRGPAGSARPGPDGHHGQSVQWRPVPGILHL